MYEIKKKTAKVNGVSFHTFERSIDGDCRFTVEVGTNGYKGGDAKKGSRTLISIKSDDNASLISFAPQIGQKGVVIASSGDSELYGLLMSMKFCVSVLEDQIMKVRD